MEKDSASREELRIFIEILQVGYYWGILKRVEGAEWKDNLKKIQEKTNNQVKNFIEGKK